MIILQKKLLKINLFHKKTLLGFELSEGQKIINGQIGETTGLFIQQRSQGDFNYYRMQRATLKLDARLTMVKVTTLPS